MCCIKVTGLLHVNYLFLCGGQQCCQELCADLNNAELCRLLLLLHGSLLVPLLPQLCSYHFMADTLSKEGQVHAIRQGQVAQHATTATSTSHTE